MQDARKSRKSVPTDRQTDWRVTDSYLKHCVPGVQLKYNATNTPYITWIGPAKLCNIPTHTNSLTNI